MKPNLFLAVATLMIMAAFNSHAQSTDFTYQGFLADGGAPANGTYDLQLTVFNALAAGSPVGATTTVNDLAITNGLFTVTVSPGAGVFTGAARWLQVAVRPGASGGAYTDLAPRQAITPAPYAITAGNLSGTLAAGQLSGTISASNIGVGSITSGMLANGAVGSNQMAAGAVRTAALADGAVTSPKLAGISNWSALTLTQPVPESDVEFGVSVAAVGTERLLIGADYAYSGATYAGAAYLFSTSGTLLTTFTNPTPANSDSFGYSVAAVGTDRVLIGAFGDNTGADDAGAAYLFSTNGTLLTTFTNPTPAFDEQFGFSVAAVGSGRVLIGASGDNTGATGAGAAYLFSTNGTLLTTFSNPTPAGGDDFGFAVAAVGTDRVLIGARNDNTGATGAGAAYLFSTNGTLLTTFTNPTPAIGDGFGWSVAAVGSDRVLIGAALDDTGAGGAGAAYLFSTNGTLLTTFTNPTPESADNFGVSVAAVGTDRVLIAALGDDTGASGAGAAYLFSTNGTLLTTFISHTPSPGALFGQAVAAVGTDRVLIGAIYDDIGANAAGAAYQFSLETYAPGVIASGVRSGSITRASLADNAINSTKIEDGTITTADLANGAVTAAKIGGTLNAAQIPNLDAGKITSGTLPDARLAANVARTNQVWLLSGNAGTTPGTHFLGTMGNQPLEFKVNNQRALRIEHASNNFHGQVPNLIGGHSANTVSNGFVGAVIGGGGAPLDPNLVGNNFASVVGGFGNTASGQASTAMGSRTTASGQASTAMGSATIASGYSSTAMGVGSIARGDYSTAMGRQANAQHQGSFVFADSQPNWLDSTGPNQFLIRASGGVGINTTAPGGVLGVDTGAGKVSIVNDGGTVPGLVMTGSDNPGILRLRNSLEIWPNTAATSAGRLDGGIL